MSATATEAARRPRAPRLLGRRFGRRDFWLRRVLAVVDLLGVSAALLCVLAISLGGYVDLGDAFWALLSAPGWIVLFKLYGLYDRDVKRVSHTTIDDVPALFHALLLGCLLEWAYFQAVGAGKLIFAEILLFAAIAAVLLIAGRMTVRALIIRVVSPERVLVIGSGAGMLALVGKMRAQPRYRLEPIAILTAGDADAFGLPLLGRLDVDSLGDVILAHRVGRVVVSDAELDEVQLVGILHQCKAAQVKVSMLPGISSAIGPSVEVDDVGGITVLGINPPLLSRTSAMLKRAVDIAGSGLLLTLGAPLLLVLAALVRLDSPGPAFFRQPRVGKGGRVFRLVKLRTMVADAEDRRAALLAMSRDPDWLDLDVDPRITRVGRFLRTTSLDELPQLWNVLKGEMSLVGPRPLIAAEDSKIDGWARGRLDLTPGMTGLWQVLGRTSLPFEEMVRLDYLYVTNWSLWGDIRLMLRTLPAVVRRRGAN